MRVDFLSGVIPALVTPMYADSSLDMLTWQQLLAWQDGQSCSAVVVLGSTAEALLLSMSEREQLLQQVKASLHNTAWIVGVSACSSAEAIKLALQAQQAGAHAVMLSAPYYIRPCQRGLLAYVHAVAAAVDLPIILYDVPVRSATAFSDVTLVECAKLPKVVGIKDASGELDRAQRLYSRLDRPWSFLSGDDANAVAMIANESTGVVSVLANVLMPSMHQMIAAALQSNWQKAKAEQARHQDLFDLLTHAGNPSAIKYLVAHRWGADYALRSPLQPVDEQVQRQLLAAYSAFI